MGEFGDYFVKRIPARRLEQFHCGTQCGKYFDTYLRRNMYGNYTIVCPNCGHNHFRVIKDGVVSDERHDEKHGAAVKIMGLVSTVKDKMRKEI